MTAQEVTGWWPGLTTDHLYPDCPHRVRTLPELQDLGWDLQVPAAQDPTDDTICGWCRRVWKARQP